MPAQTEGNLFVGSASEFEAESGGDASGVRHDASKMNSTVVVRIGIGETAS